jgi:hypothetical protein
MRHHLALKAEGLGAVQAARRFGNVTLWKENSRLMWTGTFFEQLGQDLRYALRMMNANRLFTLMAVLRSPSASEPTPPVTASWTPS